TEVRLFAENKYAGLAGETNFLHLAIFTKKNGVICRFVTAVFPAAFGFADNILALLNGGFVAIDHQAVFAGLEVSLAKLSILRNVDGLSKRLGKRWHSHRERGQESETAEQRIAFHACHYLSVRIESAGSRTIREMVLTRLARASRLPSQTHRSSWTNGR